MPAPHARVALKQGREALRLLSGLESRQRPPIIPPAPEGERLPSDPLAALVVALVVLALILMAYAAVVVGLGLQPGDLAP